MDDDDGFVEARTQLSALAVIVAFSFLLVLSLTWFLLLLRGPDATSRRSELGEQPVIAGLSTAREIQFDIIFGIEDYSKLRTRPELRRTWMSFRRDRRQIALLWLGELQRDVCLVWEFRRFLVSNGLPVTVRDEFGIAFGACFAFLCVGAARVVAFACGPFALRRAIEMVRLPVDLLSDRAVNLLARAPTALRTQLEQKWAKHILTWNPA